jgi:hypothetical protein
MKSDATAAKLTELIRICGICGGPLNQHQFALFASAIAGQREIPRLTKFFELSKQHQWNRLVEFQEWDGTRDIVQAFAIRCPRETIQMVVLKDVFEPLAANQLYTQETLEQKEAAVVLALTPHERWQTF